MFQQMLRQNIVRYLTAGIVLGIMVISAAALHNYRQSLLLTINKFDSLRVNMRKMNRESEAMDTVIKQVDSLMPRDYGLRSHREIILLTLDSIQTSFPKAAITVDKFAEKDSNLSLPVTITLPVTDWTFMGEGIMRLQSLNFPAFLIKSVVIEKTDNQLTCKIEGRLSMPSGRLS